MIGATAFICCRLNGRSGAIFSRSRIKASGTAGPISPKISGTADKKNALSVQNPSPKLKPEVTPAKLEQLMMTMRMTLLKIPEVLSVRCGKNIDPKSEWPFFIGLDFESMDKLAMTQDDAIFMKFVADVIKPHAADRLTLNYDVRHSGLQPPQDMLMQAPRNPKRALAA